MRETLESFNQRLGGLPRKALLIAATLLICLCLWALLPYVWPFALGFTLSSVIKPLVYRASRKGAKYRLPRPLATLIGMLILYGLLIWLVGAAAGTILREGASLIRAAPDFLTTTVLPAIRRLYAEYQAFLPDGVMTLAQDALMSLGQALGSLATKLSGIVATGAVATATGLPAALLSVVLTVMATYYFTVDRERIARFLKSSVPESWTEYLIGLRSALGRAVFGQVKSQSVISLILTAVISLALAIYAAPYGLFIGLIIGACDALPVVGAGLFLIPWCLFSFITGDAGAGIFLMCLYIGVILLRQVLEPRIVGRHLGVYPPAAMMSMYIGFKLIGFLGLLLGPMLLNLLIAVLRADVYDPNKTSKKGKNKC